MHILYIHQHFGTPAGSSGTRSYEFARRLVLAGHAVTMVCGASGRSETTLEAPFDGGRREGTVDGIRVIEYQIGYSTADAISARVRKFLRFGIAASRIALGARYDLIFATSTPLTAAIPGILARWLRGKPFVFEVRDLWPELPKALGVRNPILLAGMSALEWLGYHSAHRVVGLAPGIVDGIARRGIARDRIAFIPNGCDIALFERETRDDAFAPWRDRIGRGEFIAIYAGAHGIANGLDALVAVAAELKRRGRADIKLVLVGSGATKAALRAAAESRAVENILLFIDPVPKLQLAPMIKQADAGLQILKDVPAFYEGTSPNKFFDYLAAGTPVIVNYPGWIAEAVESSGCGAAVLPRDPAAFADALERAAEDPTAWAARRAAARALARARFDRDRLSEQFVRLVEEVGASARGANRS